MCQLFHTHKNVITGEDFLQTKTDKKYGICL